MSKIDEIVRISDAISLESVTARYAKEQVLPLEIAKDHEKEMKRFLILCALEKDGVYSMRGPIDEYWHTFIVFTSLYSDYCNKIARRFIHHFPNTESPAKPKYSLKQGKSTNDDHVTRLRNGYIRLLRDYEIHFEQEPPAHLWPKPNPEYEEFQGAGALCGCGCRCIA